MNKKLPTLLTLFIAVMLTLATIGGQLSALGRQFLGLEYVDAYGTQWFYWFVEHSLLEGSGPGHTNLFFYPWGKDVFAHTGANVLDAYLAIPFRIIFGNTLGYNLFVIWGLIVSALAFSRLAREFTRDGVAIGVSTVLFTFSPFILFELAEGRPTQALLALPVLFVLFMWRTGLRTGWLSPLLAGLFLALSGYQYWYYAFFGGMICAAHGAVRFIRPAEGSGGRWRTLGRHAAIAATSLLLTVPVAYSLVMGQADGEQVPGLLDTDRWSYQASPPITREDTSVGMFLWQPVKRQSGAFVCDVDGTERFLIRASWVPLVLWISFLAWLWRPGRLQRAPTLAIMTMSFLLAIGPILLLGDHALPNMFYIYLCKALPFMQRLWWPARAFAFFSVFLSIGIAVNLAHLRPLGLRVQVPAALLAAIIWIAELAGLGLVPYPMWSDEVPAGYQCLESGEEGAIIELPYAWTQAHLYYQIRHKRPIMGGMIENNMVFTPPESATFRNENTFVYSLISAAMQEGSQLEWTEEDKQAVHDLGFRYIVVQKDAFFVAGDDQALVDNVRRTRLRRMHKTLVRMAGRPVYDDARVAIYTPWGYPVPCDQHQAGIDSDPVGRTDIGAEMLYTMRPEDQVLKRWFEPPPEGDDDSADGPIAADDDSSEEPATPRATTRDHGPGTDMGP